MTRTAGRLVLKQGKLRRALAEFGAFLRSLDCSSFEYTHDRIERLEREVGLLREEARLNREPRRDAARLEH